MCWVGFGVFELAAIRVAGPAMTLTLWSGSIDHFLSLGPSCGRPCTSTSSTDLSQQPEITRGRQLSRPNNKSDLGVLHSTHSTCLRLDQSTWSHYRLITAQKPDNLKILTKFGNLIRLPSQNCAKLGKSSREITSQSNTTRKGWEGIRKMPNASGDAIKAKLLFSSRPVRPWAPNHVDDECRRPQNIRYQW